MGKYSKLRSYMRWLKAPKAGHELKGCSLVIEGESFFRQQYKESGFNFILGGEFDRYAEYLKTNLKFFIQSDVTCYVVFTGAMEMDIEKRKVIHQKIIDDRDSIEPGDEKYYDPIFTKNVHRQVLDELGIWYCVTEYNARQTLLDLSRELNCPVLTHNFEQCLLGMTCVVPESTWYDKEKKHVTCLIQTPESFQKHIWVNDKMKPKSLYDKIPVIIESNSDYPVRPLLHWIRKQENEFAPIAKLNKLLITDEEKKLFRESINELKHLIFHKRESSALNYLKGENTDMTDTFNKKTWFSNGVMTGKIPSVYIHLKTKGTFSGSWVLFEESKRDALLPVLDIVMYAHSLLWDSPRNLTFIGRKGRSVRLTVLPPKYSGASKKDSNFKKFIEETLPGFDWLLLKPVPEESWLLIVSRGGSSLCSARVQSMSWRPLTLMGARSK